MLDTELPGMEKVEEVLHGFVLAPFREIVEKGKTALENAGDGRSRESKQMRKAAEGLIREGERAIKRIEPLCNSHLGKFGANFIGALKENGMLSLMGCRRLDLSPDTSR